MTPEFQARLANEFPPGASFGPSALDRREFVRIMGASIALAGLAGCVRRSAEKIVPYVASPETVIPGRPVYYATAMPVEGFARGIVVESHEGRPTKIEGNADHPESLGSTDAITQAAILSLYDPDRSREPRRKAKASPWAAFEAEWAQQQAALLATQGAGLALLLEPTSSPSVRRELRRILEKFPKARWYQHTPLAGYEIGGVQPDYDFGAADVVFMIGGDCLYRHPAALRYGRAFAARRRVEQRAGADEPPLCDGKHADRHRRAGRFPAARFARADARRARCPRAGHRRAHAAAGGRAVARRNPLRDGARGRSARPRAGGRLRGRAGGG